MKGALLVFLIVGLGSYPASSRASDENPPVGWEALLEIPAGETLLATPSMAAPPSPTAEATATPLPPEPSPTATPVLPALAVFPDPARGAKATFRFQSTEDFHYQVELFDRFGTSVTLLTGEGKDLVDMTWPLEQVPEGLYYYRILAAHPASGAVLKYPVGRLAVEKDPTPTPTPKHRRIQRKRRG